LNEHLLKATKQVSKAAPETFALTVHGTPTKRGLTVGAKVERTFGMVSIEPLKLKKLATFNQTQKHKIPVIKSVTY
jgi:hypothetical protein